MVSTMKKKIVFELNMSTRGEITQKVDQRCLKLNFKYQIDGWGLAVVVPKYDRQFYCR